MNLSAAEQIIIGALDATVAEVRTSCEAIRRLCGATDPAQVAELRRLVNALETHITALRTHFNQLTDHTDRAGTRVPAGPGQLERAFRYHRAETRNPTSPAHYLLLFYATECGLKQLYLKQNNLRSMEQIRDTTLYPRQGHNLDAWLRAVRLPAASAVTMPRFRFDRTADPQNTDLAHQVWRYGARMNPEDEQALIHSLDQVCIALERLSDR